MEQTPRKVAAKSAADEAHANELARLRRRAPSSVRAAFERGEAEGLVRIEGADMHAAAASVAAEANKYADDMAQFTASETFVSTYAQLGGEEHNARGFLDAVLPARPRAAPQKPAQMMHLDELEAHLAQLPPQPKARRARARALSATSDVRHRH